MAGIEAGPSLAIEPHRRFALTFPEQHAVVIACRHVDAEPPLLPAATREAEALAWCHRRQFQGLGLLHRLWCRQHSAAAYLDRAEASPAQCVELPKHFVTAGVAQRFFAERKTNPAASLADASSVYRQGRDFINELPFNGDSFQVAIDLDKAEERFQRLHDLPQLPWSLPDGFMAVPDTDYEYSAYLCNDGKPELWCLLAPGVPRYHYYPRHARGPKGQYAVKDGAVEVQRLAERNVYFMRLTWAQLGFAAPPQAGHDFALTCKWNVDGGVEFGANYAATKSNGLTMHPYWYAPPSNTVRWTLLP